MKVFGLPIALMFFLALPVQADVLLLDAITSAPPNDASGVPRPHRGSSMARVQSSYGDPQNVMDAIGEPPITRWVYPSYTVYFEHDKVINVVVHR